MLLSVPSILVALAFTILIENATIAGKLLSQRPNYVEVGPLMTTRFGEVR